MIVAEAAVSLAEEHSISPQVGDDRGVVRRARVVRDHQFVGSSTPSPQGALRRRECERQQIGAIEREEQHGDGRSIVPRGERRLGRQTWHLPKWLLYSDLPALALRAR